MCANVLGWIGSLFFAACGLPQAIKSYRDGHSDGLAWLFLVGWFLGEVFYIGGTLLKFGWIDWMMFNYILNTSCLLVIFYFKVRPRT